MQMRNDPNDAKNDIADYLPLDRDRRALVTLGRTFWRGLKAVRQLLRGSVEIKSKSTSTVKEYSKTGGFRKALRDFDTVYPYNVERFNAPGGVYGKNGIVGDRELILSNGGTTGNPTIVIKQLRDPSEKAKVTERITYYE